MALSPGLFRFGVNLYPPYLGAGIRCHYISEDWREARVSMPLRWYNRNFVSTQFGGSLYSMTDAFYSVMLIQVLGGDYWVWDQEATIRYLKPGRKRVYAKFEVNDIMVNRIVDATANGEKHLETVSTEIRDDDDTLIARVNRTLYIRLKKRKN